MTRLDDKLRDIGRIFYIRRRYFHGDDSDHEHSYWLFATELDRDEYYRAMLLEELGLSDGDVEVMEAQVNDNERDDSVLDTGDYVLCAFDGTRPTAELSKAVELGEVKRLLAHVLAALKTKRLNDGDRMTIAQAEEVLRDSG